MGLFTRILDDLWILMMLQQRTVAGWW